VSPYVRTVKTWSGATAVQIVYSSRRGSREIAHLGSAHSGAEVELLKAAARQRLAAGQGELDLGEARGYGTYDTGDDRPRRSGIHSFAHSKAGTYCGGRT
jgi:hypothetical protein